MNNQQLIFVSAVTRFVEQSEIFGFLKRLKSANGLANFHLIKQCTFSYCAENELKRINYGKDLLAKMSRSAQKLEGISAGKSCSYSIFVVFPCCYRVFSVILSMVLNCMLDTSQTLVIVVLNMLTKSKLTCLLV